MTLWMNYVSSTRTCASLPVSPTSPGIADLRRFLHYQWRQHATCFHDDGSHRSDSLLRRLDFHALSITLFATTASRDYDEPAKLWDMHQSRALHTEYNESLAATIELCLASPTVNSLVMSLALLHVTYSLRNCAVGWYGLISRYEQHDHRFESELLGWLEVKTQQ